MIYKLKKNWIIAAILIFAAVLRLWNLDKVPPHLTPDEAALGYNAYSILKTAKDEHGQFMPLVFKSFGDYKPGLYIYATVPFVAIMGLNEWSVRLPSAVSGIVSVYMLFLIASRLFEKNKKLPLIVSAAASVSPWLIYFSRGAWEANFSLMLTLAGVYFFLKAFSDSRYLLYSSIYFGLTLLAYQGAKLSTSLVVGILILLYWKQFWKINTKILIVSGLVSAVLAIPIVISLFVGQTGRLTIFSIFSNSRPDIYLQTMLDQNNERKGDINYYLSHSDQYDVLRGIVGRYFNHFSARFLFFEGDWSNPRHTAPYQGMLLLADLVLLALGVFVFVKERISKQKLFIVAWLLIACLPSVLSRDQVHAVRSLNMSIPLIFVISLGVSYFIDLAYTNKFKRLIFIAGSFIYLLSFIYFLDAYFIHIPEHNSKLWEYGYKQIVETVTPVQTNYKSVKVQQSFAQPYIYFLFYQKYDPEKYQQNVTYTDSEFKGDVGYIEKLDNIEFGPIDWSVNRGDKGTLIIGDEVRIPPQDSTDNSQFNVVREIYYLNKRDLAFRIIEIKQ